MSLRKGFVMATHRLRVCIGFSDDGKPIIKQIQASSEPALADLAARTLLISCRRSEFVSDPPSPVACPSFGQYTEEWIKTFKLQKLKPTTLKGYQAILRSHFYPVWEELPIDQITTKAVQDFLCARKNLSYKYLNDMRVFLAQIMDSALRDCWISVNPAKDHRIFNPSQKQPVERQALTIDFMKEIIPLLWSLNHHDRLYLALVIFTGMRRGEVLALRWEDISAEENLIHVKRNVTYTNNQPFVGTPKTKSGFRSVPILEDLLTFLSPFEKKGFIVYGDDSESPMTLTAFRWMMKRIHDTIDLHGATAHVFRHTMGTMLNDASADVKTIQSILGQSDFKTTMDRYVHPREDKKQEAIQRVGSMLQV